MHEERQHCGRKKRRPWASSLRQATATLSDGARQSPRGLRAPPAETLGPFGRHERLNWLVSKKRVMKTSRHFRIVAKSYARRSDSGNPTGYSPNLSLTHAFQARKANIVGPIPFRTH